MIYTFLVCYTCVPQVAKTHHEVDQCTVVAAPIHCVVHQQDLLQCEIVRDCSNLDLSLMFHNDQAGWLVMPDIHLFLCIGEWHDVQGGWQLGLIE